MNRSRRELCLMLPALAAAKLPAAEPKRLASKVARFEDLPVNSSGGNRFRGILEGVTHDGHTIEVHATELGPGNMPHPPHRHQHEEMFLLREGTVELTVNGKTTRLGPGGVGFIASNDEHGIKNVGSTPAQYFVIGLGRD
ncbi:MAG: cupin domain-containing protein [Terriglobia bacterium]